MGDDHLPTDVPQPMTALIGRGRELAEVSALIRREEIRLVTLTGTGGIGKTRLALAVAAAVAERFANGVCFIPLAAIRDAALVLPTIAQSTGVPERAGMTTLQSLVGAFAERRTLLVLDNFEQVSDAAGELAHLLERCPQLAVLVTSRKRLRVRGEHEVAVQPLAVPAGTADAELIARSPAVSLFVARAQEVQPDFDPSGANGPAIAEICRRLDGLPLAIELAAAKVKVLPPAALLVRLVRRLPLLNAGPNDLPDRLRTMRNAVAWSYELLTDDEQALFRRMSVFVGGFTLLEARAISADAAGGGEPPGSANASEADAEEAAPDPAELALLEGLANLVDNSLLRQPEVEAEPRFQMLETLREYGLEQLQARGDLDEVRGRHADFFIRYAEAATQNLRGAERTLWLDRLEQAHDNMREALTWLTARGDLRAVQLAGVLWQFWWWRSHIVEGRQRLEAAVALPGAEGCGINWARALTGLGALAETQGDYAAAEREHERAVAAWTQLNDVRGLAISLLFRWLVAFNADDQARMTELSSESLRRFREVDEPSGITTWGIAMSLMQQGVQAMRRVDVPEAKRTLSEGIALFARIGDKWGVAICQGVLGNVFTEIHDYQAAAQALNESLSALLVLNDLWGVATVMPAVARLAVEQGAYEHAVRISGAVQKMHETLGVPLKVPFRERYERNLIAVRHELGADRFAAALAEGRAMTPRQAVQAAAQPVTPGAAAEPAKATKALNLPLSAREREVVRLVPNCTAKEIGQTLFISESTVRTHIENILNKLGLRNQKELIGYIHEHGLG